MSAMREIFETLVEAERATFSADSKGFCVDALHGPGMPIVELMETEGLIALNRVNPRDGDEAKDPNGRWVTITLKGLEYLYGNPVMREIGSTRCRDYEDINPHSASEAVF